MIYAMRYHLLVNKDDPKRERGPYYVLGDSKHYMEYTWKNINEFAKSRKFWVRNVGFMHKGFLCVDYMTGDTPFFVTLMKNNKKFDKQLDMPFLKEHTEEVVELQLLLSDMCNHIYNSTERYHKVGLKWSNEEEFRTAKKEAVKKLNKLMNKYKRYHLTSAI